MKIKYISLFTALTSAMLTTASAQDVHPDLQLSASKIDTKAEFVQLNRISGDLSAITEYLDLILDTARKNDQQIPPKLKAKDLMKALAISSMKANGTSSTKVDNAWVNRSFLDNGGNNTGIFSFIGEANTAPVVPSIAPAGTDLALQLQLDLRQTEKLANMIAEAIGEKEKIDSYMKKPIPELGMTFSEVFAKLNLRVNFMMNLDSADTIPTPFGILGRPFIAARIDGVAWLWDKVGQKAIAESNMPLSVAEQDGLVILKLNEEGKKEMLEEGQAKQAAAIMKLSPIVIIDKAQNYIWIGSNEDFLKKCMSGENTLAESAEYKSAMEGLPTTANSMAYISKELLNHIAEKYTNMANIGMLGEDFEKAKLLADRLMVDITESDKAWVMLLTKENEGIFTASRLPLATKHLQYFSGLIPYSTPLLYGLTNHKHSLMMEDNADSHDTRRELK